MSQKMNDKIIRTLIVELMGRYSNIMLVNDKLYIIDALKIIQKNLPAGW